MLRDREKDEGGEQRVGEGRVRVKGEGKEKGRKKKRRGKEVMKGRREGEGGKKEVRKIWEEERMEIRKRRNGMELN